MALAGLRYAVHRFVLRRPTLVASIPRYGLRLRVGTRDVVGRHLYKYGVHEADYTEFIRREVTLGDGDVAFDVGAHVGWYALVLSQLAHGSGARIVAFEPDPANYALLTANVEQNGATAVTTVPCAVAHESGTAILYRHQDSNRGAHSLLPFAGGEPSTVPTVALDAYVTEAGLDGARPAFLKVDVEGFELNVLRGAPSVLRTCPLVMCEYSPAAMRANGLPVPDLFDLMAGHGYQAFHVIDGRRHEADVDALMASDGPSDIFWQK